jgi:hypothetical protein
VINLCWVEVKVASGVEMHVLEEQPSDSVHQLSRSPIRLVNLKGLLASSADSWSRWVRLKAKLLLCFV